MQQLLINLKNRNKREIATNKTEGKFDNELEQIKNTTKKLYSKYKIALPQTDFKEEAQGLDYSRTNNKNSRSAGKKLKSPYAMLPQNASFRNERTIFEDMSEEGSEAINIKMEGSAVVYA